MSNFNCFQYIKPIIATATGIVLWIVILRRESGREKAQIIDHHENKEYTVTVGDKKNQRLSQSELCHLGRIL